MQPETRRRVLEAMESLSYRPNRVARQLRGAPNPTLGLIVPSVANPFWGSWAAHLEAAFHAHGRQIYLCNTERDPERERAYVEQLWADGIEHIVLSTSLPSLDHLRPAMDAGVQIIAFDREHQETDPPELLNVSIDNEAGAWMATQHLIEQGHRRIAFVSGAMRTISRQRRFAGYVRALAENGIPLDEALVPSSSDLGDADSGPLARAAVHAVLTLDDPPTAVVAVNDHHVMGAWEKATGADGKILFLADGAGLFTRAVGLDIDLGAAGLGLRSKRYAMIVEDGVVKALNVEEAPGVSVSGAAAILGLL